HRSAGDAAGDPPHGRPVVVVGDRPWLPIGAEGMPAAGERGGGAVAGLAARVVEVPAGLAAEALHDVDLAVGRPVLAVQPHVGPVGYDPTGFRHPDLCLHEAVGEGGV